MPTWKRNCLFIGCLLMAIAVATGALGAHGLESRIDQWYPDDAAKRLTNWETAVRYQVYHAIGLIALGILWPPVQRQRSAIISAVLFASGILLFSGCLYAWVLSDIKFLVHLVPIGGLSFIVGWCMMCWMIVSLSTEKQRKGNE